MFANALMGSPEPIALSEPAHLEGLHGQIRPLQTIQRTIPQNAPIEASVIEYLANVYAEMVLKDRLVKDLYVRTIVPKKGDAFPQRR